MTEEKFTKEEFKVSGEDVLKTIKKLVKEGNIRRIIIKNEKDHVLLEFPLTVGVIGAALLPVWAAIGAVAALVTNCTIVVEKREQE
jgi:DNA-binding Lrp family transcriptional regulator